jgi:hypothetical protein
MVNSPEGRAAMAFMVGLMKDRLIAPEIDRPDSRRLFAQGASAFYIDAPQTRQFVRSFSGKGEAADAFTVPIKTPVLKRATRRDRFNGVTSSCSSRAGRERTRQPRREVGPLPHVRSGADLLPGGAIGAARDEIRTAGSGGAERPVL